MQTQVAWRMVDWFRLVGLSRKSFYSWPEDFRPRSTLAGNNRLITEPPEAWLARMAEREAQRPARGRLPTRVGSGMT